MCRGGVKKCCLTGKARTPRDVLQDCTSKPEIEVQPLRMELCIGPAMYRKEASIRIMDEGQGRSRFSYPLT